MILELDCGNSLIKWRVLREPATPAVFSGAVSSAAELLCSVHALASGPFLAVRLVSVRSEVETQALVKLLGDEFSVAVRIARSADRLGGISSGYSHPEQLGPDRWLAMAAAYEMSPGPCLVLDLGTAVTADFISSDGQHLGGYIAPGIAMMRKQLSSQTQRISYAALGCVDEAPWGLAPGCSTSQAVERGCLVMLRGFVAAQMQLALECLGEGFEVYLTGGDAPLVVDGISRAIQVPDLVLRGLSLACPLEGGE